MPAWLHLLSVTHPSQIHAQTLHILAQYGILFGAVLLGDGNQDKSSEEVPEQSEPTIIYVDWELTAVVLRVSLWDFLQLVGVDDPKRDHGEVTKVYGDGFVQLQLIDGVSVEY